MKGIKKTLIAGFLACSVLQAQAVVDNPWGGGVKAGYAGSTTILDNQTVRIQGGEPATPWSHFVNGGLYGAYAFSDCIEGQVSLFYQRQKNSLKKKDEDNIALTVQSDGVVVPISFYVYPFGREEGEGAFSFHLGGSAFFSLSTKLVQEGNEIDKNNLTDNQKRQMPPRFNGGIHSGIGWEFPFGLTIETRGYVHLRNRFSLDNGQPQTIFNNASDLKKMQGAVATVIVGYNLLGELFTS